MNTKELDSINLVDAHLEQYFDDDEIIVYHESESPANENHIDVYWIRPKTNKIEYAILLTVGMSRHAQYIDEDSPQPRRIEIAMLIPKDWDFSKFKWQDDELWPIRHLQSIAKIPSQQKTWIGFGHTISWKVDESCFPGTKFNASLVIPSPNLPDSFTSINLESGEIIFIYSMIQLFPEELAFKRENSTDDLLDKFDSFEIGEIIQINRLNTCENIN